MAKVAVLAGGEPFQVPADFDQYVGVDGGCIRLLDQGHPLDLAVGDFDSVSSQEWQRIEEQAGDIYRSTPEKNDTDLELALKAIFHQDSQAQVAIYGALGGRIDHLLSSAFLPTDPDLAPFMRQFYLLDQQNKLYFYPSGSHRLSPEEGMKYIGFMPVGSEHLVIEGAKYPLHTGNYFKKAMYGSNEFEKGPITITVPSGYVLVVYSKDRG